MRKRYIAAGKCHPFDGVAVVYLYVCATCQQNLIPSWNVLLVIGRDRPRERTNRLSTRQVFMSVKLSPQASRPSTCLCVMGVQTLYKYDPDDSRIAWFIPNKLVIFPETARGWVVQMPAEFITAYHNPMMFTVCLPLNIYVDDIFAGYSCNLLARWTFQSVSFGRQNLEALNNPIVSMSEVS